MINRNSLGSAVHFQSIENYSCKPVTPALWRLRHRKITSSRSTWATYRNHVSKTKQGEKKEMTKMFGTFCWSKNLLDQGLSFRNDFDPQGHLAISVSFGNFGYHNGSVDGAPQNQDKGQDAAKQSLHK
jgi:hypothetical protein